MGSYLNPSSGLFQMNLNSEIYVDKSELLKVLNKLIMTEQRFVCVSRPRRFGKSMAATMLAAYYGCGEDTSGLFDNLKIASDTTYRKHLNQYNVLKINMQEFLSSSHSVDEMLALLQKRIVRDLKMEYPDVSDEQQLVWLMQDISTATNRSFVILIDEWDCLFREYQEDKESQKKYLDFLRLWLKDQSYVGLAYMTGILPVKKYGSHSALNMFWEYSMMDPGNFAEYFGFTEEEVKSLCDRYAMSFEEAKAWYDGYELVSHSKDGDRTYSMYSPKSVSESMLRHKFGTYWNQTETYEALKVYIQMNFDGLKDAVVRMLAGDRVTINTGTFTNDMTTFHNADDVLSLLVHLGYLTYRWEDKTVAIPNKEVAQEYINAISTMDWKEVIRSVNDSRQLLEQIWEMNGDAVAKGIHQAHSEISILQYNDENSLSCTIMLALYFAREYYNIIREFPTGKGFADICMIPRQLYADKPALLIELKWDKSAGGAIEQIRKKEYVQSLKDYRGNLLLVGINYNRDTKEHECRIEKYEL